MGDEDDIDLFDEVVYEISLYGDNTIISDLCTIFNDSVTTPAAMENLIKSIFSIAKRCGLDEGMYQFLRGVSKMIPHAKGWALKINSMILNSEPYKEAYNKAIKRMDNEERKLIVGLLSDIKIKYNEKFSNKIADIINTL